MRLGLTGSFGSGKTTVSDMFREHGIPVIDADVLAREVTETGEEGWRAVVETFGEKYLGEDGSLDRRKLGRRVFSNREDLQTLESIVHPLVRKRELALLEKWKEEPLVILSVPLLFEKGLHKEADQVVVVTITEEERFRRLMNRYGLTEKEIWERLNNQMPQEEKISRADYIIDNSGSLENTRKQVEGLIRDLSI